MHVVVEGELPTPVSTTYYIFDSHHDAVEFVEQDREHRAAFFVGHDHVNPESD